MSNFETMSCWLSSSSSLFSITEINSSNKNKLKKIKEVIQKKNEIRPLSKKLKWLEISNSTINRTNLDNLFKTPSQNFLLWIFHFLYSILKRIAISHKHKII